MKIKIRVSSFKKFRIYGQNIPNILLNLTKKSYFSNDVDIQLFLEFKYSFGKYHPVFPKILKRFLGHAVCIPYIRYD